MSSDYLYAIAACRTERRFYSQLIAPKLTKKENEQMVIRLGENLEAKAFYITIQYNIPEVVNLYLKKYPSCLGELQKLHTKNATRFLSS